MSNNIEEEIKKEQIKNIDNINEEKINEKSNLKNKKINIYIIIFISLIILNSLFATYNDMHQKKYERELEIIELEQQMREKQLKGNDNLVAKTDPECKNNDQLTGVKNPFCINDNKNQDPFLNTDESSDETDPFCKDNQCLEKKYIWLTVEQAKEIAKKDWDIIRAINIDWNPQIITDDIINNRVNATIQKGIITKVSIEYINPF